MPKRDKSGNKAEVLKRVEAAKEELGKIPIPGGRMSGHLRGFTDFVREQGVVGLAIGFVLGVQVKALVDQLVASFIDPVLGLVLPGKGSLAEKSFALSFNDQTQHFVWGAFIYQLITFLIVAAVIYFVFKGLKLDLLDKKKG